MDLVDKVKNFVSEKVENMPKPEASVKDLDLKGVSRECISYQADVAVKNPYGVPIPICEISYVLKSSGSDKVVSCLSKNQREIATGHIPDPGSLKGNDTTILNVLVKVPYNVLLSLARDIGADWDIDYQLDIGLIVDLPVIGKFTIPLSQKGEVKLPTFSDLFSGGGDKSKDGDDKVAEK